jgi:hypothetical protein
LQSKLGIESFQAYTSPLLSLLYLYVFIWLSPFMMVVSFCPFFLYLFLSFSLSLFYVFISNSL